MRHILTALFLIALAAPASALDVNGYRAQHGLPALRVDSSLAALAWYHARDLAARNALDHRGFKTERGPLGATAENASYGCGDETCAILQWGRSPHHRAAMLRKDVSTYGLATAIGAKGRHYWVMELGGGAPLVRGQKPKKQYKKQYMEAAAPLKR